MGLRRRDATRNTCINARACTEMITFNARTMQRELHQRRCVTDQGADYTWHEKTTLKVQQNSTVQQLII